MSLAMLLLLPLPATPWGAIAAQGGGVRAAGTAPGALEQAMRLEDAGRFREAAVLYRAALGTDDDVAMAILGLERAMHELGTTDSLIPVVDSILLARPAEGIVRSVQLRSLRSLGRFDDARTAFESWVRAAPREAAPYREFSRMLLETGRAATADTILRQGQRALGTRRDFAMELASTHAALGDWEPAARAWREAVEPAPYLEQAAVFALTPVPAADRMLVREAMLGSPISVPARRILARLELGWGSPSAAWSALAGLPKNEEAVAAWSDFADRAEEAGSWLAARDALVATLAVRMDPDVAARAASLALEGGDAESALALAERSATADDSASAARRSLLVRVRALGEIGRPAEAERVVQAYSRHLQPDERGALERAIAWGWVRTGDVERARTLMAGQGSDAEEGGVAGWLALYSGDLRAARRLLRVGGTSTPAAITAMALLSRTRADSAPQAGEAFLALARGDTLGASRGFERAARELPDAAPVLLSLAARLRVSREEQSAVALWQRILSEHAASPEAAEADLEWARLLRRRGDDAGAIQRLEHLILTYPDSALVPQARRELELARRTVPPPRALRAVT